MKAIKAHDADRSADRPVIFASNLADAKVKIDSAIKPNDVLLMVGAGDIDELARSLPSKDDVSGSS